MGKKKEKGTAEPVNQNLNTGTESDLPVQQTEAQGETSNKKTKKHKRKKTSREKKHPEKLVGGADEQVDTLVMEDEDQEIFVDDIEMDEEDSTTPSDAASGAKLQISIPESPSEKNLKLLQKNRSDKNKASSGSKKSSKKSAKGEDDTDSEEERWLDAIESGKLEEVDDELKRIKNPRLMTARQRALMEKRSDVIDEAGYPAIPAEPLLALPTGFREKVLTEEMIAKKAIKSKRRREQAIEKREEDKKKTVDRLLKKQDSRGTKTGSRPKEPKMSAPTLTYLNNREGIYLSFPVAMETNPIVPLVQKNPPKPVFCGLDACYNLKKYSCSKTGVPLCSLECYRKNLEQKMAVQSSVT